MSNLIGSTVRLKGKTLKGKNRVNEHGELLKVEDYNKNDFLLKSTKTDYLKWGPAPDFDIVAVFQSEKGHG